MEPTKEHQEFYTRLAAALFATFSLIAALLIVPPLCWHYRNRNVGATCLVAWVICLNLQSFINAVIWHNDDIANWYMGQGLCDIEVKLQVASQVAIPASFVCVLRALANVMDTDRITLVPSRAQKIRNYVIDGCCCIIAPVLQMVFDYIVAPHRYLIYTVTGCVPAVGNNWITVILIYLPPVLWCLLNGYFAALILVRLYNYRARLRSILANNNMSKSRFMRLYSLCLLWVLGMIPTQGYVFIRNLRLAREPFSWADTHDPAQWNDITTVAAHGALFYDRFIWLTMGYLVFFFFGMSNEATSLYKKAMLAVGLGKIFPCLTRPQRSNQRGGCMGSINPITAFGSRVRLLFHSQVRAPSGETGNSVSTISNLMSPVTANHESHQQTPSPTPSRLSRVTFAFSRSTTSHAQEPLDLTDLSGFSGSTRALVTAGSQSPSAPDPSPSGGVMVRREVRQGSETAVTTLPAAVYHAA